MKLKIKLNGNTQGLVDLTEPILLPESKLELEFSSDLYTFGILLVSAKNGKKERKRKLSKPFTMDISELLYPGAIEIEISMISKAEVVKRWRLQDIYIKEIEHKYEIIPEIAEMKGAIKEITEILKKNNLM